MMSVFVIIPTYNEVKTIGPIVRDLIEKGFRVVVIDDGSFDNTYIEANRYGAELIIHSRNEGKGCSLREGLEYALGKGCSVAIFMDGDGQHHLNDIEKFLREHEEKAADIVIGNRLHRPKRMPFLRRCTNVFMSFVISLILGERIEDSQCGYRLLSRRAMELIELRTRKYEIESEILLEAKRKHLKISSVNIESIYKGESSQIDPFFDTLRFIRFIINDAIRRQF